jgi:hypothetical protein
MNLLLPAISVLIAVFVLTVLSAPGWLVRTGAFGGLAFVILAVVMLCQWLIEKLKSR